MNKTISLKASWVIAALMVTVLGPFEGSWAGQGRGLRTRPVDTAPGTAVEVTSERDFESFDAMLDWLQAQDAVDAGGDDGMTLGRLRGEVGSRSHGCVCPLASPESIVVPRPRFIKLIELNFNTSFGVCGSCGLVVCARLAYQLVFVTAPPQGAFLFGPRPRFTLDEVCVGQTASTKAYLILTSQVPTGQYLIRFEAVGAADVGIATVFVTIQ